MGQRKNKSTKDKSSKIKYPMKVGIPKGFVVFNSVEQQNAIMNKKADKNKPASYYSLTFDYSNYL